MQVSYTLLHEVSELQGVSGYTHTPAALQGHMNKHVHCISNEEDFGPTLSTHQPCLLKSEHSGFTLYTFCTVMLRCTTQAALTNKITL